MVWFVLISCRSGDPTTLVDELRVMAIQSEPAEIGAETIVPTIESEDPYANILISNPLETQSGFAVWTCTNFGEGCIEKELFADNPENWIQYGEIATTLNRQMIVVHPGIWGIVSEVPAEEQPFQATFLWVLACETGVCSAVDDLKDSIYDVDFFSDPFVMMSDLPLTGTSLSFRFLLLSTRPQEERIQNPILTPLFSEPPTVTIEETTNLSFSYELFSPPNDDSFGYAYTTIGGFAANSRLNNLLVDSIDDIDFEWFAPEEEKGAAEFYVIVEDGSGGSAIWTGTGEVQ